MVAALVALIAFAGAADAKKRIVVLDFTGPKADGFQAQVEGVVKKAASMVSAEKWNAAADDLGAGKMNAKTVAKIAAKLNVDGVVVGSVDRRGSRYFVHVKLRAGSSGEQVAEVELVARSGKLTSSDLGEVKDQIVGAIEKLDAPGDGGDDEADSDSGDDEPRAKAKGKDKAKAKGKHKLDDGDDDSATASSSDSDSDDEPKAKGKAKDKHRGFRGHDRSDDDVASADSDDSDSADDEPKAKGKAKAKDKAKAKGKHKALDDSDDTAASSSDSDADDEPPARSKSKSKGKDKDKDRDKAKGKHTSSDDDDAGDGGGSDDSDRVASSDDASASSDSDDDADVGAEGEVARDAAHRPLDALAGFSFTSRNLSFTTTAGLANKPQGYKSGIPVTGLYVGADLYPLAFNAKNKSITRDFGVTVMFDRVLSISSQLNYKDMAGATQTASLGTTEQRLALGVIFRHVLNPKPLSPTLFASIRYNRSKFVIDKAAAPMGVTVDIPNTDYTYVDPGVGIRYPISPKIALDGGVRLLVITNTGEMQQPTQYGAATVLGFDVDAGGDYTIDKQWFVHAGLKLSTIGFTFKGTGDLSNNRDGDPTTIDVQGARDTYYGAVVTAGYLY